MKTIVLTTWNNTDLYWNPNTSNFVNSNDNDSKPYVCDDIDYKNAQDKMNELYITGELVYNNINSFGFSDELIEELTK